MKNKRQIRKQILKIAQLPGQSCSAYDADHMDDKNSADSNCVASILQ